MFYIRLNVVTNNITNKVSIAESVARPVIFISIFTISTASKSYKSFEKSMIIKSSFLA